VAVFTETKKGKNEVGKGGEWLFADPDAFEEEICGEVIMVTVDAGGVDEGDEDWEEIDKVKTARIEKRGGGAAGVEEVRRCVLMAVDRWVEWHQACEAFQS